jgi:alpha-tubulin suppressor-like RCC1 family protein
MCSQYKPSSLEDDKLYGFGTTMYLGVNSLSTDRTWVPIEVLGMRGIKIKKMGSSSHTCALTENGKVYCWGYSVGIDYRTPEVLNIPRRIIDIAVGANHCLFVTGKWKICECNSVLDTGKVYGLGNTKYGEAGLPNLNSGVVSVPTEILSLSNYKIVSVSAGNRHSMFLTDNGKVFVSGSNRYGYGTI